MQTPRTDESIFAEALEKTTPAERAQFLSEACGDDAGLRVRVEKLLRSHDKAGSFLGSAAVLMPTLTFEPITQGPGTVIGPYKLMEQIGEGGMGLVFVAEQQEPVRRKVALKLIKPGLDSAQVIARFEAERQALAMMDHLNIAKVLDAGATESGRPYFVMELVHGVPITEFCDNNKLTPQQRMELFVPVCHALQHAHLKGIIHRDIKPSNILVTMYDDKPVPKVIDFGVAKAIEQRLTEKTVYTQFGTLVGTFEYMSPEQAELNAFGVDTRSDIYSLGVLLYELLTGTTPLDRQSLRQAAFGEIVRLIKEEEPPKPSTRISTSGQAMSRICQQRNTEPAKLANLVRGELDWIVMKCLEKDRTRRYETASNLARDVERFLADEPVEACPPTVGYRLGKFWRRHKGPIVAAGLVLAALVFGVIGTTWGLVRAELALQRAAEQTRIAERSEQQAQEEKDKAFAAALNEQRAKDEAIRAQAAEAAARNKAEEERDAKDQALIRAEGLRLVAQSELIRAENPGRALLLAVEGAKRVPGLLANNALIAAMDASSEIRTIWGHEDEIDGAALSADNRTVLSWSADKTARLWDAATGREVLRLPHAVQVVFACYSPDGKRILTMASRTGVGGPGAKSFHIWDSASGREVASWKGGDPNQFGGQWQDVANPVKFSADGQRVVVTYGLYPVESPAVYETETGRKISTLNGHLGPVLDVDFSPNGKQVLTGSLDGTARIWDAETGNIVHTLKGPSGITCASFSPDGSRVLTIGDGVHHEFGPEGGHSSSVDTTKQEEFAGQIWDAMTGAELAALRWPPGHRLFVRSGRFSNDGRQIMTVGFTGFPNPLPLDERIYEIGAPRLWDGMTGQLVESFKWTTRDAKMCVSARFGSNGMILAMTDGKVAHLSEGNTGKGLATLRGHDEKLRWANFSPDATRVVTVGDDRQIRIWDASAGSKTSPQHHRWHDVLETAFLPDGRHLLADHQDEHLRLWDIASGREVWRIKAPQPFCQQTPMLSADGERVAIRYLHGVYVWETRTGKELFALDSHEGLGGTAMFSPDGKRLVTRKDLAPSDPHTHIWDVDTKTEVAVLEGDTSRVGRLQFSPDSRRLLTTNNGYGQAGSRVQTELARLFDAQTGKQIGRIARNYSDFQYLKDGLPWARFSSDGQKIVTAFSDQAVIWDAQTCQEGLALQGHIDEVVFAIFSADGQRVLTTSRDRTARIWDATSGRELKILRGHTGKVTGGAFSPDGTLAATWAEADPTIWLWETATGKPLITWKLENPGAGGTAKFSVDGQWLAIRSGDGTRLQPVDPLRAALQRVPRELTFTERLKFEIRPVE